MYRYIATSRAKNIREHSAHTCCSYGAKKHRTSNLKPQTLNADACGLHPDRLKPRRDLKLKTENRKLS